MPTLNLEMFGDPNIRKSAENQINLNMFINQNEISQEDLSKAQKNGLEVYEINQIAAFLRDLNVYINKSAENTLFKSENDEIIEKAKKDLSHLVKKQVVDKNGKRRTVYVRVRDGEKLSHDTHTKKPEESESRVWTKEQESKVKELDKDFKEHLKKKNIDPYSKEASDEWKRAGFRDKQMKIFGKKPEEDGSPGFKVGSKYKRDSGMGGTLTFEFIGEKDGKLQFKNTMHKDYGGGKVESYTKEQASKQFTKDK